MIPEVLHNPLAAGLLASFACGIMGTYVVVKRIAYISGGISHSAYGGVGLGYMLNVNPLIGASAFSILAALGIGISSRRYRQNADMIIGVIWAVGMALGILFVNLSPNPAPDLMSYIFGNILFTSAADLYLIIVLDAIIIVSVLALYKEFMAVSFDEEFAEVIGVSVERIYLFLLCLIALTVVVLIRVVGVILVIALLTIPQAAARLYVERLGRMMVVSVIIGAACTIGGLVLSYVLNSKTGANVPQGPLIILLTAVVYVVSLAAVRRK